MHRFLSQHCKSSLTITKYTTSIGFKNHWTSYSCTNQEVATIIIYIKFNFRVCEYPWCQLVTIHSFLRSTQIDILWTIFPSLYVNFLMNATFCPKRISSLRPICNINTCNPSVVKCCKYPIIMKASLDKVN